MPLTYCHVVECVSGMNIETIICYFSYEIVNQSCISVADALVSLKIKTIICV